MDAAGSHRDMNFVDASAVLLEENYPWLAVLVWLFIQAIPAVARRLVLDFLPLESGLVRGA
jgi:paraquat-inducible protein A